MICMHNKILLLFFKGRRDSTVAETTDCSYRGPQFHSQHPQWVAHCRLSPQLLEVLLLLTSIGTGMRVHMVPHRHTHVPIIKNKKLKV